MRTTTFTSALVNKWALFFAPIMLLIGCYGPKRVNKWMEDKYGTTTRSQTKTKDDYFSISSKLLTNDQGASTTAKHTEHLLPLIFYWQADYINTVTLNPKIPVTTFSATFRSYANTKGLKQKLNGAKIEVSVDAIPNVFAIDDRGHVVWLIFAYGWDVFSVIPENKNMVVSYRVLKDSAETKNGKVIVEDMNKPLEHQKKVKEGTLDFLAQYDENIKSMTRKAVDKILEELN